MPLTGERKRAYMWKYSAANRERQSERFRQWRESHKDEVAAYQRAYYKANPQSNKAAVRRYQEKKKQDPIWRAEQAAKMRAWRAANPERFRENTRAIYKRKYGTDPNFVIKSRLRSRLQKKLLNRGINKVKNSMALTGCTPEFLRGYLEAKFEPGMQWNNVHIDHVRPLSSFDLRDPEQQRQAFHYTNLRPLFAIDNIRKGARWRPD